MWPLTRIILRIFTVSTLSTFVARYKQEELQIGGDWRQFNRLTLFRHVAPAEPAMNAGQQDIQIKRVSSRKRPRDGLKAYLTPARERGRGSCVQPCPGNSRFSSIMAQIQPAEYCSDSEDLFGDYDSILEDSSLLAKLDDAEQNERDLQSAAHIVAVDQQDCATLRLSKDGVWKRSCEDILSDSILDGLGDEAFEDLPASQIQFQEQVRDNIKRSRLQDGDRTSTPSRKSDRTAEAGTDGNTEDKSKRQNKARRSMTDQLKRAMLCNAAAPSSVSRTVVLKEAVVSEEISVAMQAMETVSAETTDLGPFFGLPTKVKDLLHKLRGIMNLYDWQQMCLNLDCVQQRKNLIYSLPTSGGKTLVAEILILRELLCRKKDCLFILPYISLVQEKVRGLASFGLELDFMVEEYAGSKGKFPPVKRRNKTSIYITTIEKAHSLVNSLIETSRLDNLGLVVVDELHMLGDGSRGAVIEMTLAKLLYMSKKTQIIGMSATLGNIRDLQTFLKAENYTNDFRPVQLKEYVKLNDTIYEVDPKEEDCFKFSRLLKFKYSSAMQKIDPDHIIALVAEVIPTHSCLVFCPTKKNCENVAGMICKYLKKEFLQHREAGKAVLLRELRDSGNGSVCPVLRRTVPYGLAYHHSGLTTEERKLVEEAYSNGVLCLLTCTSTLAAGINLPARRVILRSPYVGTDFLKRSQYKQMVGRAGRAGIDTVGESILILQDKERNMAKTLVCAPMENCFSNLMHDGGKGILSLILSLVGLNITTSLEQMREFLRGTLLHVQEKQLCVEKSLWDVVQQCVDLLKEKDLITVTSDSHGQTLQVTKLGKATYKGSVDLTYSDVLYKDLSKGLEGLLLNSYLHLVYLVTPYDMISQCKPDWMVYFRQFTLLTAAEQKMSAAVGVPESFVTRKAAGQTVKNNVNMVVVRRMYLALVLFSLLKETNLWSVADRFQLSRGFIQTLLSSSSAFCSCVLHFTEELEEFWPFKALLTELTRRLSYCVKAELIPLMEVAGVMESRAKQLYNAGYKTLTHLANADPAVLSKTIENLYKKQANQIVASAKMLLNEKAAALQEEVDDLLMMPLDLPTALKTQQLV
ncbi:helicase POLQ-like isoform X2 [Xiphias gladius]|uniref:helicase POLQ-like isoform X2 n=1 Tax=Xiphias gladius TaxID=8245 RepID=UPI001A994B2E|nr:helicase POLQ-like isoform X2 [Xiphias gladius]